VGGSVLANRDSAPFCRECRVWKTSLGTHSEWSARESRRTAPFLRLFFRTADLLSHLGNAWSATQSVVNQSRHPIFPFIWEFTGKFRAFGVDVPVSKDFSGGFTVGWVPYSLCSGTGNIFRGAGKRGKRTGTATLRSGTRHMVHARDQRGWGLRNYRR
jgi:hypothetical protein